MHVILAHDDHSQLGPCNISTSSGVMYSYTNCKVYRVVAMSANGVAESMTYANM